MKRSEGTELGVLPGSIRNTSSYSDSFCSGSRAYASHQSAIPCRLPASLSSAGKPTLVECASSTAAIKILKIAKLGNIMRLDVTGCDLLSPEDYAALLAPSY